MPPARLKLQKQNSWWVSSKSTWRVNSPTYSQLSLEGLAGQVGMTKHDLSQLINDQLNTNFFGFVNDYRIEAFKERLTQKEYEHYTLLGIALETGFNSKSSFNSIFKKAEGITPSAYKKQIQSKS